MKYRILPLCIPCMLVAWMNFAKANEDCDGFFKEDAGQNYRMDCEEDNKSSGGDSDARVVHNKMNAVANDGSHFIFVYRTTAGLRTYITDSETINQVADQLLSVHGDMKREKTLDPWKSSKPRPG